MAPQGGDEIPQGGVVLNGATGVVKMAMPPPTLEEFDTYEEYEDCIWMWSAATALKKADQGPVLALSLPNESKKFGDKIRKNLFLAIKPSSLNSNENGVTQILAHLKLKIGVDERISEIETFHKMWRFERKSGQTIQEYVTDFEEHFNKCTNLNIIFPDNISAYMLLAAANLTEYEYKLIKAVIDLKQDAGKLYKKIKSKLVEMLSNSFGNIVNNNKIEGTNDAFLVD